MSAAERPSTTTTTTVTSEVAEVVAAVAVQTSLPTTGPVGHWRRCLLHPVTWRRRTAASVAVVLFLVVLLVVQYRYDSGGGSPRWHWVLQQGNSKDGVKLIVLWTPFFDSQDYGFGLGRRKPFIRAGCRPAAVDCETTIDRSRMSEADALVFHMRNTETSDVPPRDQSNWHQRFVFFLMESPDNTERDLRSFAGLFNWTMTYRLDSDIVAPYFEVQRRRRRRRPSRPGRHRGTRQDKAFVSWLVSNCKTTGHRERYVNELRQHLAVDVFGACGSPCYDQCERLVFGDPNNRSYTGYKFYLAFENSVCRDYVTEKLSNALRHGVVPVVYGGADYDRIAPPRSYVDVRRFESPRHLAHHLIELNGNDSAYASHLEWAAEYEVIGYGQPVIDRAFCRLCAKLHAENRTQTSATKFYGDIDGWWTLTGNCSHSVDFK